MRKIRWSQGREHEWKCDGIHDPGMFDEDFGTIQSPGVRADAQCFKISFRAGNPTPPEALETLLVSEREFVEDFN